MILFAASSLAILYLISYSEICSEIVFNYDLHRRFGIYTFINLVVVMALCALFFMAGKSQGNKEIIAEPTTSTTPMDICLNDCPEISYSSDPLEDPNVIAMRLDGSVIYTRTSFSFDDNGDTVVEQLADATFLDTGLRVLVDTSFDIFSDSKLAEWGHRSYPT